MNSQLPSALECIGEIVRRAEEKQLVLFLDYDGTLTPIVARPELATLTPGMRETLKNLAERCPVAIISGRDRADVQSLVKVDALIYAGSHGFDIAGPKAQHIEHQIGAEFVPEIDRAEATLRTELGQIPAVLIERKKFSVAVHYRLVAPDLVEQVGRAVDAVLAAHPTLRKKDGKKVYDLQPRIEWDKGRAVLWVLEALHADPAITLPIYLGDDVTDEDAFRALRDSGIGIFVGAVSGPTSARYVLTEPDEVQQFLGKLTASLGSNAS